MHRELPVEAWVSMGLMLLFMLCAFQCMTNLRRIHKMFKENILYEPTPIRLALVGVFMFAFIVSWICFKLSLPV